MNIDLIQRVKNSLNKQYYIMNDSWLGDCVDFYTNDHECATHEEITAFVMNQWTLYDLREINNENGCLPRNLVNQKCTTLPGKYILQVDKMYDISTSKYKQLEKIRNVSSENIEATENENKTQDDKFQNWEPKSKRMLQLFLTDGVQDIVAVEYKTIRFLKELLPGYKLMIKGPVICRKGVILLEENNIVEVGGEVDSLLVVNAVENVLARALNLNENPDPYNDANRPKENTESTQKSAQVNDHFDIDLEAIDEIERQIVHQSTNPSKSSTASNLSSKQSHCSKISEFNYSYQAPSVSSQVQKLNTSSIRNQQFSSGSNSITQRNKKQQDYNSKQKITDFDDEGDSFLEMVDDSAFKTPSVSVASTAPSKIVTTKQIPSTRSENHEFPDEDEIYDLIDTHSPFFSSSKLKLQSSTTNINSQKKDSFSITNSPKNNHSQKHIDVERASSSSKRDFGENSSIALSHGRNTSKIASQNRDNIVATPSVSDIDNFNDNLDLNDINMDLDGFDDYFDVNTKNNSNSLKSSQAFTNKSPKVTNKNTLLKNSPVKCDTNSTVSSDISCYDNEFEDDFYERCKRKLVTSQKSSQLTTKGTTKSKNEESVTGSISFQTNGNSSVKLSDKLKFENKNKDYYNTNNKLKEKSRSSETSTGSLFKSKNTDVSTETSVFQTVKSPSAKSRLESKHLYEDLDADLENDFGSEFEARMEIDNKPVVQQVIKNTYKLDIQKDTGVSTTKSQDSVSQDNNFDDKSTGSKRPASLMSPSTSSRPKLRCLESTPKDKTISRKITDFFDKPKPKLLNEHLPLYEPICDALKLLQEKDTVRTVVRGKVVNVVKLNLLKGDNGSYFHLEGTITDGTAKLDVVFCSEVLEEIVGYSTQEFILKRKQGKADPKIKDELRDDLKKAQHILRLMDALMEIELNKNGKTIIIAVMPLTKEDKKRADERLQRYKMEKS